MANKVSIQTNVVIDADKQEQFFDGLIAAARAVDGAVMGGETVELPDHFGSSDDPLVSPPSGQT